MGGAGAAAEHGGDPAHQGFLDLLGRDEMDMGVHAACGEDAALAGDDFRGGADDDGHSRLGIRIAGLADAGDPAVLEADIRLENTRHVDHEGIGNDRIDSALGAGALGLPHAIPDHLAAAELYLLAIGGEVILHLDDELGIGEAHAIARGGAIHVGIGGAGNACGHGVSG